MTAELTFETLRQLASRRADPSVSLFLPTHRYGPEISQDRIRLKNLLADAVDELVELGHRRPEAEDLVEPARRLLDQGDFWQHRSDGLGLLLSAEVFEVLTLPSHTEELEVVSDRFHITPLLSGVDRVTVLLLALSRSQVRLFELTRTGIAPVDAELPTSIDDTAWFADREAQLQHRAGSRGSANAVYHGHPPEEDEREDLRRFLTAVAGGVGSVLRDRAAPLLITAVDELAAAYRQVADHDITEPTIAGNPDERSPDELAEQARSILQDRLERLEGDATGRVTSAVGRGEGSIDLGEILEAATAGRVEEVVVGPDVHPWASSGSGAVHAERQPGDDDLIDRAVSLALQHGGEAWTVESAQHDIAASFRF